MGFGAGAFETVGEGARQQQLTGGDAIGRLSKAQDIRGNKLQAQYLPLCLSLSERPREIEKEGERVREGWKIER